MDWTILVKNYAVIEVCFRKVGVYCNFGKIVVDVDTYDFAGILTYDKIIGYYKEGSYIIFYHGISCNYEINPITHKVGRIYPVDSEKFRVDSPFKKTNDLVADFSKDAAISTEINDNTYVLTFDKFITDQNEAQMIIQNYMKSDLIRFREN